MRSEEDVTARRRIGTSMLRNLSLSLLLLIGLASCSTETKIRVHVSRKHLDNGMLLSVSKRDSTTKYRGVLSGHDYGTDHTFEYSFQLDGNILWEGYSAEPKDLVVCAETMFLGR